MSTTLIEAAQKLITCMRLDRIEAGDWPDDSRKAYLGLKQALAQQEQPAQEPVEYQARVGKDDWRKIVAQQGMSLLQRVAYLRSEPGYEVRELYAAPTQPALTQEQAEKLAHRRATTYTHRSDPNFTAYAFTPLHLMDFVRDIEAHCRGGADK